MEETQRGGFHAYLPDECWELIFLRLREEEEELDLASLSLVSKRFLSITNRLKISLELGDSRSHSLLPRLLQRFQHLKTIIIFDDNGDNDVNNNIFLAEINHLQIDGILLSLPRSCWKFGANNMLTLVNKTALKTLDCSKLNHLQDSDLIVIADLFPSLEELRFIASDITDDGVEVLATKLKDSLQSITFFGFENPTLTDQSLISLSSNCKNLRKIHIDLLIYQVTEHGVGFVMRHSPNLTDLSILILVGRPKSDGNIESVYTIENSILHAKNLQVLNLIQFSDQLAHSFTITEDHPPPPLKKLNLRLSASNQHKLILLLQACHESLEELTLIEYCFSTDSFNSNLFQHFPPRLTYIEFFYCSGLSPLLIYSLLRNCPLLGTIIINSTAGDATNNFPTTDLHKNYQMQRLSVFYCNWLNNETLQKIGRVCPNLQVLCVNGAPVNEAIGEIVSSCSSTLRYLDISFLWHVSNVFRREDSEQLIMVNLKTLKASRTRINDEDMAMIGKRCPRLQFLEISGCLSVTDKGVKEVVMNCKRLREIDLSQCANVSVNMLVSMPSLKKIIPPDSWVAPNKQLPDSFLCFGCKLASALFLLIFSVIVLSILY